MILNTSEFINSCIGEREKKKSKKKKKKKKKKQNRVLVHKSILIVKISISGCIQVGISSCKNDQKNV